MLALIGIVAAIIIVAVVDIAALALAGKADKQMEIERPDLVQIRKE